MSRLHYCIKLVLGHEGGKVDHKNDRGGRTAFGVTQKTFDDFCKMTGRPQRDVWDITQDEVELIYSAYWKDAHCSYMPEPLDCIVFDSAINHGAKRAIKILQRALGIADDGICGKQTLAALHEEVVMSGIEGVCQMYLNERAAFYDQIIERDPSQSAFARGWANRVEHLREMVA
jgi:lysozyme family protein